MTPNVERTVECPLLDATDTALKALARRTGLGEADVINAAIQFYDFVDEQIGTSSYLVVRHPDGSALKLHTNALGRRK